MRLADTLAAGNGPGKGPGEGPGAGAEKGSESSKSAKGGKVDKEKTKDDQSDASTNNSSVIAQALLLQPELAELPSGTMQRKRAALAPPYH